MHSKLLSSLMLLVSLAANGFSATSVTQWGITWYFHENETVGQYANGDYWVLGPVVIDSIKPRFTGKHNGWQVNPIHGRGEQYTDQGFDVRASRFVDSLVPELPYSASGGESIVKTISSDTTESTCRPCLRTAAVLTVVDAVPPDNGATVFRPPYSSENEKPAFSVNDLRTDLLPSLPAVAGAPTLDAVVSRFGRVQMDHVFGKTNRPKENLPDYGGDIGRDEGHYGLRLMLDDLVEDKMPALIAYIQCGIDLFYINKNGQMWVDGAGEQPCHTVPMVFASVMLDNQEMKDSIAALTNINAPKQVLPGIYNDRSTYYGKNNVPLWGHYGSDEAYWARIVNETGSKTLRDPYGYIDSNGYIVCCVAQPWKAQAMVFHVMPEMKKVWYNPSWFDFVDRWVTEGRHYQPDPCAPSDGNWDNYGITYGPDPDTPGDCIRDTDPSDGIGRFPDSHGTEVDGGLRWTTFVRNMWSEYREGATEMYDLRNLVGTSPSLLPNPWRPIPGYEIVNLAGKRMDRAQLPAGIYLIRRSNDESWRRVMVME